MDQPNEAEKVVPLADRLLSRYGNIASLSFDKGFSREEDRQLLGLYIGQVIVPKRARRTEQEK